MWFIVFFVLMQTPHSCRQKMWASNLSTFVVMCTVYLTGLGWIWSKFGFYVHIRLTIRYTASKYLFSAATLF